jgi:hypothetical protein
MERLDILFVGIAFMFLAGIMYIYWVVGDIQRCFGALRRRLRNSAAGTLRSSADGSPAKNPRN